MSSRAMGIIVVFGVVFACLGSVVAAVLSFHNMRVLAELSQPEPSKKAHPSWSEEGIFSSININYTKDEVADICYAYVWTWDRYRLKEVAAFTSVPCSRVERIIESRRKRKRKASKRALERLKRRQDVVREARESLGEELD